MRTLRNYISIISLFVMLPLIAVAQGNPAVVYIRGNYANNTTGGSGSSWDDAINGNAYYHYDGTCDNGYKAVSFTGSDSEVTSDSRFDRMTFIFENNSVSLIWGSETDTKIYLVCREDGDYTFEFSETKTNATEFYLMPATYDNNGTITSYYICLKSNPNYKMASGAGGIFSLFANFAMLIPEEADLGAESFQWKIYKNGSKFYFLNGADYSFGRNRFNAPDGERYGYFSGSFNRNWTIHDRQKGFQYALVKAKNASKPSYVFVKEGNYVKTDGGAKARDNSIVIPEGVHLYGGIENGFTDEASGYSTIEDYVEKVKQTRPGIALSIGTKVGNVMTIATESYDTETIFDGLYVYGNSGTVDIDDGGKKKVTLCNSLVTGNTTITSGLFYNSLARGDIDLATNGYAANVTYSGTVSTTGNKFNLKYKESQDNIYKYQLEDNEVDIDNINNSTSLSALESFGAIDYDRDRDFLGNPRKMGSQVDVGAFEAWCVRDGTVKAEFDDSRHDRPWNYYPISNTNVFLMENGTFVLGDNLPTGYAFAPRKLLLKEGASLYGQGYNVNVNDISIDLNIPAGGRIISLPFTCNYSLPTGTTAYIYNGSVTGRAIPGYKLNSANCWSAASNPIPACQGVFYYTENARTVRFSATGTNVYTEESASKGVTLSQYDDYVSEANDASFTSAENMGWNCIGIPYLVSDYKPYLGHNGAAYTSGDYMMNIPHNLWLYYANTDSYKEVPSWDGTGWNLSEGETAHLWFGEGIFTQTAAVSTSEALTFYRPVYVEPSSPAKAMANTRHYVAPQKENIELEDQAAVALNVNRNILTISNLKGDEMIDICSADGIQHRKAEVRNGTYSCTLRTGMYVVKVNDFVKKVMVK